MELCLPDAETVVLVEGPSDHAAVTALAEARALPLADRRVAVVSMGGATSVGRHLALLCDRDRPPRVLVVCDQAEARYVGRVCDRTWPTVGPGEVPRLFVCRPDLESELITAHGVTGVLGLVEAQGDGPRFRRLQHQPAHRGRPVAQQLRRFFGSGSGRKIRYGEVLSRELAGGAEPEPLRELIIAIVEATTAPAG